VLENIEMAKAKKPWVDPAKVKYRCRGPRVLGEDGKPSRERVGCGYDKTKEIHTTAAESQRRGGVEIGVKCPKCESVGFVKRMPADDDKRTREDHIKALKEDLPEGMVYKEIFLPDWAQEALKE
jgi:hypothetical protein